MSIDPGLLQKWDSEKESLEDAFQKQFSMNDRMQAEMSNATGISFGRTNAHFDARYALGCTAKAVESGVERVILNTSDRQQALVIDVAPYQNSSVFQREDNSEFPLVLARVSYSTYLNAKNESEKERIRRTSIKALTESMPPGNAEGKMIGHEVQNPETMAILLNYFKKNCRLLSKEFLLKFERGLPKRYHKMPGVFTTFISPLYTGKMDKECSLCGIFGKQKLCSRCKLVRYCSTKCQREDWKRHKSECATADLAKLQLDEGEYLEIDPKKNPTKLDDGVVLTSFSCKDSTGKQKITQQKTMAELDEGEVGESQVWKIQVPMRLGMDMGGIMIYTKGKKNLMQVVPDMCADGVAGYKKLYQLVKEKGDDCGYGMGGLKLFLYGARTEEEKLRLNVGKVMPLQPW